MADIKLELTEKITVSDSLSGTVRKVVDPPPEDLVIARFWVQNFSILEKTSFDEEIKTKLEKILKQLAEDMLSLRDDIMDYAAEVRRYFEGVKSGEFYEVKDNIEYFKEVFHGKKLAENFYFHAELCKRDAFRLMRIALPSATKFTWEQLYQHTKIDRANLSRLTISFDTQWENLLVVKAIRGVMEHSDDENDFDITDIRLEKTDKGIAFHQPYFIYPESVKIKSLDGTEKTIRIKDETVLDLMDKHFWAIFNVCESSAVYPLLAKLGLKWQPKLIGMQHYDPKCPVQWVVEPASNPRRTVNHTPV